MMYKHLKRGTLYEALGEVFLHEFSDEDSVHGFYWGTEYITATFQFSGASQNNSRYAGPVILYKGLDNRYWLRPVFEFNDGRFEACG